MTIVYPQEDEWSALSAHLSPVAQDEILRLAVRLAFPVRGNVIEFGVAEGTSTKVLRQTLNRCEFGRIWGARKSIFACDSFEGLTERFENAPPGSFAAEPPSIRGVEIVKGFFDETLTPALASRVGPVALASLDADLHSSTLTALRWLTPLLNTGSLLLFDEYTGEDRSEQRAHEIWTEETGVRTFLVAEFLREPSGWGTVPDRRSLFRVVRDSPVRDSNVKTLSDVGRYVRAAGSRVRRGAKAVRRPSTLEQEMAGVWTQILGNREFGYNDNFFDVGGTSLGLVEVKSAVSDEFGVTVQLSTLFNAPTISQMASAIERARSLRKQ